MTLSFTYTCEVISLQQHINTSTVKHLVLILVVDL